MRIELHPGAKEEFTAQIGYYEAQEPGLGQRFYREAIATFEWIGSNPRLPRLRKGYRRVNLTTFPFYIIFSTEPGRIWILAVAHASRRPEYWRKRIQRG